MGEELIDVLLDNEETLPADPLVAVRTTMEGPAGGAAVGTAKGFRVALDITIPSGVKTKDINRYMELAFGDTLEPVPVSAEGKVRLQCT